MDRTEASLLLLEHAEGLVSLGEQRAYIIGATNILLIVAYGNGNISLAPDVASPFWKAWPFIFSGIGLLFSVIALNPQTISTSFSRLNRKASEMIHFGSIGCREREDFVREFHDGDESEICEKILRAVHHRSQKAREKFALLAIAAWSTIVQLLPFVIFYFYSGG